MEDINSIQWPGWKTVRLIGRGSYGAVYEIERNLFGKKESAALKHIGIPHNPSDIDEMYSDGYDDESVTAAFQSHLESIVAEYSLMRKLNGAANVVNCDDVQYIQRDDGIGWDIYIKMELLTPLTKALPGSIPEETVIKIAKDMCQALVLCKRFDIVHRDIKPQNIFVSPLGDYKLGDFGIAKTVEKTMGGTKTGTYKYMAPEVYNNQPYGQQADIYSLGLVLYWMLNMKRMPFMPLPPAKLLAGADEQARNRRLTGEQIPPPAAGSEELKRIVLRACAFDPNDRYHTAAEMLEDLNAMGSTKSQAPRTEVGAVAANDSPDDVSDSDDEATVGLFYGSSTSANKNPDVGVDATSVPQDDAEEDRTVGLFGDIATNNADHPPVVQSPAPEENEPTGETGNDSPKESQPAINHTEETEQTAPPKEQTKPVKKGLPKWIYAAVVGAVAITGVVMALVLGNGGSNPQLHQPIQTIAPVQTTATITAPQETEPVTAPQESEPVAPIVSVKTAAWHTAGLRADGTVVEVCSNAYDLGQWNVSDWRDIVDIALGNVWTYGLKSDGTVVATGYTSDIAACEVSDWKDIVAISASDDVTVGLKSDGTVVAVGRQNFEECEVSDWTDIVAVECGAVHTVGLKSDGTVVTTLYGPWEVTSWEGIVAVAAGSHNTLGLKSDGTVVSAGADEDAGGYWDVSDWKDIVAISAHSWFAAGLKSDGTVVTVGRERSIPPAVSGWTDIKSISVGPNHIVGQKWDGTVVAAETGDYGAGDVSAWQPYFLPDPANPGPATMLAPGNTYVTLIPDETGLNLFTQQTHDAAQAWGQLNDIPCSTLATPGALAGGTIADITFLVENGTNVLLLPGYSFGSAIGATADSYPQVKFIGLDVSSFDAEFFDSVPGNVYLTKYQVELSGFMAGYASVRMGYTKLGFLGSMAVPEVIRYGYGFLQGADAAARELGIADQVSVNYTYADTYESSPDITNYLTSWYNSGTEVVFACGGTLVNSAAEAASLAGKKIIGYDTDWQDRLNKSYDSKILLTSAVKKIDTTVTFVLNAIRDGKWSELGGNEACLGILSENPAENFVGLAPSTQWSSSFTEEDYNALVAAMYRGSYFVRSDIYEAPKVSINVDFQDIIF